MTRAQIMETIQQLAKSQGAYGRLLYFIQNDEHGDEVLETLERQNFKDSLDLILFIEG